MSIPHRPALRAAVCVIVASLLVACATAQPTVVASATPKQRPPTVEEATAFIADAEERLATAAQHHRRVEWVRANFVTADTNWLSQKAGAESTRLLVDLANAAKRFNGLEGLSDDVARKLRLLKLQLELPAPSVPGAADELATLANGLDTMFATGTIELDGKKVPIDELEELMATSDDPTRLEEIWTKWRRVSVPMAADYARMVEIANAGAVELGYADLGQMWLSKYDMAPEAMSAEVERLWQQVKPLYDALHCHVRARLSEAYGAEVVPLDQPIRADLLGNMWAQQWGTLYSKVAPKGAKVGYDLTKLLLKAKVTPRQMVEYGDRFFQSLGIEALPATFWDRSLIEKPRDRDVVCHASAWDLDAGDDVRIKMCTKITADDFQTVHHELGHNIYQRAYKAQPYLYQEGAHDGFHEAIGDFIALSITPEYLVDVGLLPKSKMPKPSADLGLLMQAALDKISFLPFGLLMDKWRWQVFSGEVAPAQYNAAWWDLRTRYQGIRPPSERPADAFDPGAKYHIPGNTPYLRYFLSFVMQFQFHEAACRQAGWTGPLHRCSIYGSKEVGERFNAMMEMGTSKPWPDVLEAFTGTREMDGSAIVAYFAPLMEWLETENAGRSCGW